MQYDKYEKRIRTVANLLKLMFKHMTKILISLGTLAAVGISLLATRGIIVSAESCPVEMTYGEELGYSAKAFLSDTGYEYSLLGTNEWTRELPRVPGEYSVRAVAKATFGYRYGDVHSFTLNPKPTEVAITSESVVYGELPTLSLGLVYGDSVDSYSVVYNEDKTVAKIDLDSVKIVDKNGSDVTACYSLNTEESSISTKKREISIKTESATKVYDGSPLTKNEYSIVDGTLAAGDYIEMSFEKSIASVGIENNLSTCKIYDADGNDVTRFYSVKATYGSLEVTKRPILIKSESQSTIYDGTYQSNKNYSVLGEYGIAPTDTLIPTQFPTIRLVGQILNEFDFEIKNEAGEDVASNYAIEFDFGVIEVTKRAIVIKTGSQSEIYNGQILTDPEYTVEGKGIAPGDKLEISLWNEIIDVGTAENSFVFTITAGDAVNVEENYEITFEWGKLEILKKPIKITTPTSSIIYNGGIYSDTALIYDGLVLGDEIQITSFAEIKNAGTIDNNIDFDIVSVLREVSVKDNYDITLEVGTLTVSKRLLSLKTNSREWQYDGAVHSEETILIVGGDGLLDFHRHELVSYATITEVGEKINEIIVAIFEGEEDVTQNYQIDYEYGTLLVYGRDVTVTTESITEYYNGKPISAPYAYCDNLSPLHTLKIISGAELTNVGEIDNVLVFDIVDENGESVIEHYNVTVVNGKITVLKRPVTVTTGSRYEVYSGLPVTSDEWSVISEMPLAEGHTLSAPTPNGKQTNIGYSANGYEGEIFILDADGNDVTDNYDITALEGTLEVIKRPISIKTNGYVGVYTGKIFRDSTVNVAIGEGFYPLCDGHRILVDESSVPSFLDAMDEPLLNFFYFDIVDESGESVISNYDITEEYGEVNISRRPIKLTTNGYVGVYTGKIFRDSTVNVILEEGFYTLCDGHMILVDESGVPSFLNAMDEPKKNEFFFEVVDADGSLVEKNYDITYEFGEVNISPRPIKLTTNGYNGEYNGKIFYDPSVNIILEEGFYPLCDGHRVLVDEFSVPSFLDAMDEPLLNEFLFSLVDENGNSVDHNYDVTCEFGEVYIAHREIKITTNGIEKEYDGIPFFDSTVDIVEGSLCEGHRINVLYADTFIDATDEPTYNEVIFEILDENGNNVDRNYVVIRELGEINITKRKIKITTNGYESEYTGKIFCDPTINIKEGSLAPNHSFNILHAPSFKNAMISPDFNAVLFEILDEKLENVDRNYEVEYEYGVVNITKRKIKITTNGYDAVYNGKYFSDPTINIKEGSLCEGHSIKITYTPKFKDNTEDEETPLENNVVFEILDENLSNVDANYEVSYEYGKINISKRPIKVSTNGIDKVYDGKTFFDSTINVLEGSLCEGHSFLETSDVPSFKGYTDGTLYNEFDFIIIDESGADVDRNYVVDCTFGEVNISKREIVLSTNGIDKVYDGREFVDSTINILEGSLCDGHSFEIISYSTFKNAMEEAALNEVIFEIVDENGEYVSENYEISCEYGIVTISRREISVVTNNINIVYDGKLHTDGTVVVTAGSLCDDHTIGATSPVPSFKNYTEEIQYNEFTIGIFDEEDVNVTDNYDITCVYGEVSIAKRDIELTTGSFDGEYDGKYHGDEVIPKYDYSLCEDHIIWIDYESAHKNVVDKAENRLEFKIFDEDYNDVGENYNIKTNYGIVTIRQRYVYILTGSYSWTYDGMEHKFDEYTLLNGSSFATGHTVKFNNVTYVKDVILENKVVQSVENRYEVSIYDEEMYDVSENYCVVYEYGRLTITKCEIVVDSVSRKKVYDGTPLYAHKIVLASGSSVDTLPAGYKIIAEFYEDSQITEVGRQLNQYNMLSLDILDENGVSVKSNYKITYRTTGILEILPKNEVADEETEKEDVYGEGFDDSRNTNIGLPENYDSDKASEMVLLVVTADSDARLYLKHMSYGKYTGSGWMEAIQYNRYINNVESAYYLPYYALEDSGILESCVKIESPSGDYVLPYYSTDKGDDAITQTSDTVISGYPGDGYTVYYYYYEDSLSCSLPAGLAEYEVKYSEFVHSTYCEIDRETLAFMKGIISERGFDANDPDIINKVAKYIQNAAKYSFDYNRALDESDNIAVDFLKSYKQGVCQHYATAATMLYRALGIPARYTVGYTVFAKQDIPTNVTALMKHAWVEVYVDGFGWINVEVTGSAEFGSGINGGNEYEVEEDKPIEKPKLLIWPDSCSKSYDGTPLTYDKKTLSGNAAFRSLISSGFTYRFTVSGSQTEIGTSNSEITSFTLYDRNQNDVTTEYEIIFSEGSLTVNDLEEIRIYISRHNYVYNGSFYTYESDEWTPIYIPEGVELRISRINLSICDIGRYTSQMINENVKAYLSYTVNEKSTGIDVTKNYRIIVADYTTGEDYTVMQVTKREIKIKTNSATKVYDGTELRAEGYELSFGTLCEGHWISMVYTGSITDVGSTQNRVTRDIRIYYTDANGRNIDVTDNYNFPDPEFGTLTVTQS